MLRQKKYGILITVMMFISLTSIGSANIFHIERVPREQPDETLITERTTIGLFGGPVVKFSQVNDEFAVLVGGYGGFVINRRFVIGGGGYGLTNEIAIGIYPYGPLYLKCGYGGVMLGYVLGSRRIAHLFFHTLIGGGAVSLEPDYLYDWYDDAFFVFEPGLDLEFNITRHFRMGIGGTYRFVDGIDTYGLNDDDISGASVSLTFKFGSF
ncbi:MAG: hypothetical protein JSW02_02575 [candidate division WOR-3 bacterium]|nr:MAG: hypothetical protein JSW02_02575 [candidate division WOR-3 bacterium]